MTRRVRASACLLASLLVGAGHASAQGRPLTTEEVVQRALERNRDLFSARERVAEAQGLLRQAGVRWRRPSRSRRARDGRSARAGKRSTPPAIFNRSKQRASARSV